MIEQIVEIFFYVVVPLAWLAFVGAFFFALLRLLWRAGSRLR